MFKLFAVAAVAAAAITPAQAIVVTQWTFNSTVADASAATGALTPAIGTGSLARVGGTSATFASGDANGGSSDPAVGDDSGWNIASFATQGTGDKTRGVQFNIDTTGYAQVVVSWDQRHSNTASRHVQFQYTVDGSNFIDAAGGLFSAAAGDTWYGRSMDLSGVTGVANNASFGFRIVATFAPDTSTYVATNAVNNYATTGTNRFDMVTVMAAPVPEPETYALMLAGLAAIGLMARRRA